MSSTSVAVKSDSKGGRGESPEQERPAVRVELPVTSFERAVARHEFVKDFDRRYSDWTEIAQVCVAVERDKDFEILGFKSWHAWVLAAAPKSRSYIYLVCGRYKELEQDFSPEELSEIPLNSTRTLRKLSPAVRRDPEVLQAARTKKPRDLVKHVREKHPEQHIADEEKRTLALDWGTFDDAFETFKALNNPACSLQDFVDTVMVEWMDEPLDEAAAISRRQRAQQIGAL